MDRVQADGRYGRLDLLCLHELGYVQIDLLAFGADRDCRPPPLLRQVARYVFFELSFDTTAIPIEYREPTNH
jgi:hypothetical protein